VAIKPFSRPEDALHELNGYDVLQQHGVETFDPLGVFPAEHTDSFIVLTKKRSSLMSLDRDDWVVGRSVSSAVEAEQAQRNTKTVQEIAVLLAKLHNGGVFLPDGQIKNFAVTTDGKVGAIDTENILVKPVGDLDSPALAWNDISKLTRSLVAPNTEDVDKVFGVGMLAGLSLVDLRESCDELIMTPYIAALSEHADASETIDHGYSIAMHVHDRFYADTNWPDFMRS
jgi:hypothetical protein